MNNDWKNVFPKDNRYFETDLGILYFGDCAEIMKTFPDNSIDLTITSPPYDNLRNYKGYTFNFEAIAKELFRITKKGGVVVWVVGDATIKGSETGTSFRQALYFKDIGFNLHDTMIYRKLNYVPLTHNRYEQEFEYMFVLSKGKPKTFNPIKIPCKNSGKIKNLSKVLVSREYTNEAMRKRNEITIIKDYKIKGNIFEYVIGGNKGVANKHPAIFPEKLAEDHIISWSNKYDLILDPMAGSGTTLKMAKLNNRKYIGIEISKDYCEIAKSRIEYSLNNEKLLK